MKHKIQPLIPGNPEGLEEIAKQLLEGISAGDPGAGSGSGGSLIIDGNSNHWTITGVNYRNQIQEVRLLKTLLDNGNAKTQDEWIEYSKQARARNDFYTGDYQLYHSLFKALYLSRDSSNKQEIEEARVFLEKQFKERWLMTLTRIRYLPQGKDSVIHNYGMPDKLEIPVDFMGKDEWVKDSKTPQVYNALLGTNNLQEINQIYSWITKKPAYLWRVNNKPKSVEERVAWFIAYSDRANFYCNRFVSGRDASFGVRVH